MRAFALGFVCGVLALLWWIGRSMSTAERVPSDRYLDDLADILRQEAW